MRMLEKFHYYSAKVPLIAGLILLLSAIFPIGILAQATNPGGGGSSGGGGTTGSDGGTTNRTYFWMDPTTAIVVGAIVGGILLLVVIVAIASMASHGDGGHTHIHA